jgi:hypothetical protein
MEKQSSTTPISRGLEYRSEGTKVQIEKEKPKAEENWMHEIFVVFAAMRQGTWLPIVWSRLPKEEKGKAKAEAKAKEKERVDGNREEEEKEKWEKLVQK